MYENSCVVPGLLVCMAFSLTRTRRVLPHIQSRHLVTGVKGLMCFVIVSDLYFLFSYAILPSSGFKEDKIANFLNKYFFIFV